MWRTRFAGSFNSRATCPTSVPLSMNNSLQCARQTSVAQHKYEDALFQPGCLQIQGFDGQESGIGIHDSRFTIHDSPIQDSRFTIHDSRFTIHGFTIHDSPIQDSRFTIHHSRLTIHGSRIQGFTIHHSPFTIHFLPPPLCV